MTIHDSRLVLTLVSTVVQVLHLPTVSSMADIARGAEGAALFGLVASIRSSSLNRTIYCAEPSP